MHQETFGKSGCRRIVPGQFLACDPKGRALMIGSTSVICYRSYVVYSFQFEKCEMIYMVYLQ